MPFPTILTPSQSQVGNRSQPSAFQRSPKRNFFGLTSSMFIQESHKRKCRFKIVGLSYIPGLFLFLLYFNMPVSTSKNYSFLHEKSWLILNNFHSKSRRPKSPAFIANTNQLFLIRLIIHQQVSVMLLTLHPATCHIPLS